MDDSGIVELFLSRDESALSELAQKYGSRLLSIAYGMLGDHNDSEEVINDAYLSAWNLIPPNEPREYLFEFMASIVRHKSIDLCRKRNAEKRSSAIVELTNELAEVLPSGCTVESEVEAHELGRLINSFVSVLPEEKRALFVRRYWFFDSEAELSLRFGWSKSKVKVELFRLRKKLAAHLLKEGYGI